MTRPEAPGSEPRGLRLLAVRAANVLGKPFGINPFPRTFPNGVVSADEGRADVFDRIYRKNFWASDESRSGLGSESHFARAYRERLRQCLLDLDAKRVFDAPCGDLNWIAPLAADSAFAYRGGDISAALVADVDRRFPDLDIERFDICADPFPEVDVWHCRDCLFHLPFADIRKALDNFSRSRVPYALLTTHKARIHRNLDVAAGGFRYLDLERAPVSLPSAQVYLKDYRRGRDFPRYVGLWRREAIAEAVQRWSA